MASSAHTNANPIVVDLDGTVIKSDMLLETANTFVTTNPLSTPLLAKWLAKGRANLKSQLAKKVKIEPQYLPYNEHLLEWLKSQKTSGKSLVLATASHIDIARPIADHLGIFDKVMGSTDLLNLKGTNKQKELVKLFGEGGFEYVGDARADLPIWKSASKSHILSSSQDLIKQAQAAGNIGIIFPDLKLSSWKSILKACRIHQWAKNILVFVPLLAAHRYLHQPSISASLLAFFVFCLIASSVYLLNDLVDISNDRQHKKKKYRPFASGDTSIFTGWLLFPALLIAGLCLSLAYLPFEYLAILGVYYFITLAYSFFLKSKPIVDVLTLACLYTIRVIAGAVAIAAPISHWLLAFSLFVFFSLAMIKRYSELAEIKLAGVGGAKGRGYASEDIGILSIMGVSSGLISVLVLALFIQDPKTSLLYNYQEFLWLICPIFLYWISRIWFFASRGKVHEDPVLFALKDPISWLAGTLGIAALALAKFLP